MYGKHFCIPMPGGYESLWEPEQQKDRVSLPNSSRPVRQRIDKKQQNSQRESNEVGSSQKQNTLTSDCHKMLSQTLTTLFIATTEQSSKALVAMLRFFHVSLKTRCRAF